MFLMLCRNCYARSYLYLTPTQNGIFSGTHSGVLLKLMSTAAKAALLPQNDRKRKDKKTNYLPQNKTADKTVENRTANEENGHELTNAIDAPINIAVDSMVNSPEGEEIFPELSVQAPRKIRKTEESLEMSNAAKKIHLHLNLCSFIDACLKLDQFSYAHSTVMYYIDRGRRNDSSKIDCISIFNLLLKHAAQKGNLSYVKSLVKLLKEENILLNWKSYISWLEAVNIKHFNNSEFLKTELEEVLQEMKAKNFLPEDVLLHANPVEENKFILKLFEETFPSIKFKRFEYPHGYTCSLLDNFYHKKKFTASEETRNHDRLNLEELQQSLFVQLSQEKELVVNVDSVLKDKSTEKSQMLKASLAIHELRWKEKIAKSFKSRLLLLENSLKNKKTINILPYLKLLPVETYMNLLINEIRILSQSSEYYGLGVTMFCKILGHKVMLQYMMQVKQQNGHIEKMRLLYTRYLRYTVDNKLSSDCSPREYWQRLLAANNSEHFQASRFSWPHQVYCDVGRFLYDILMQEITITTNFYNKKDKKETSIPAFYTISHTVGNKFQEDIHPHHLISQLYLESGIKSILFNVSTLPMLCPPAPWIDIYTGGFLLLPSNFVRIPKVCLHMSVLEETPNQQLYPVFDSLNYLSICPWIINKPILDLVIEVFNQGGDKELGIAVNPSTLPNVPHYHLNQKHEEKIQIYKERARILKLKREAYSLWCDTLYKLSIANYVRDRIFWFPHNLDFRGRVYPTPPHFNHLGSDLVRALLLFARGKPLGTNGLNWLKIHLINLTSLKKSESNEVRLQYANEIMSEILDSAYYPFNGRGWWRQSEDPWQTLACCKELAQALQSGDPENYVSHFPVHQDGSCNGLQHYAALGRDSQGAEHVNLLPSPSPKDVYSGVAFQVEIERKKDAENGNAIAKMLEGHINRKVVKQTVMTTVYGVTKFGARLQIQRRLQERGFPPIYLFQASKYLVEKTFFSIGTLFSSSSVIQQWFANCASQISCVQRKPIEWVTPLGFPVVQPYLKVTNSNAESRFSIGVPNTMKHRNAFPPNFIHSLDSTHMMLTTLFCERKGIDFVSVHDCYWTHPSTVDKMNKVCREQFVSLHEQKILEDLSDFLYKKFSFLESEIKNNGRKVDNAKILLNYTLKQVPQKGNFNIKEVLKSTYFFS